MLRRALISISICLLSGSAFAEITAEQFVEKDIVVRDADGSEKIERIKADKVSPGEEVIYSLRFSNSADFAADAVTLVMPVPREVSYVEGSVAGDESTVTFSADGGQTYVARGRLTIAEEGIERPAKGDEITHIKWLLTTPLAAAAMGVVSYRGVLK